MRNYSSDIPRNNWVDSIPSAIRPYIRLARFDRPIGTWLVLFPGWWSLLFAGFDPLDEPGRHIYLLWLFLLFGLGAIVMRGAGCILNDVFDKDYDSKVARTSDRPLPSGEISTIKALVFMAVLSVLGLAILIQFNFFAIIIGASSLLVVFVYPLMKRITHWPQLILGLAFNWGALLGWATVKGEIGSSALVLYISGIFWTLGYDTIYALQDKKDDLIAGVKSSALKLNENTKFWLFIFYFLATVSLLLMGGLLQLNSIYFVLVLLSSFQLFWQVLFLKVDNPKSCLGMFHANKLFGWLILCAVFFGKFN